MSNETNNQEVTHGAPSESSDRGETASGATSDQFAPGSSAEVPFDGRGVDVAANAAAHGDGHVKRDGGRDRTISAPTWTCVGCGQADPQPGRVHLRWGDDLSRYSCRPVSQVEPRTVAAAMFRHGLVEHNVVIEGMPDNVGRVLGLLGQASDNKRPDDRLRKAAQAVWDDARTSDEPSDHLVTSRLLRGLDTALERVAPCARPAATGIEAITYDPEGEPRTSEAPPDCNSGASSVFCEKGTNGCDRHAPYPHQYRFEKAHASERSRIVAEAERLRTGDPTLVRLRDAAKAVWDDAEVEPETARHTVANHLLRELEMAVAAVDWLRSEAPRPVPPHADASWETAKAWAERHMKDHWLAEPEEPGEGESNIDAVKDWLARAYVAGRQSAGVPRSAEARTGPLCPGCDWPRTPQQTHAEGCPNAESSTIGWCGLTDERVAVLASRAGGHYVGAPATREEERAMACEIRKARAQRRESPSAVEPACSCESPTESEGGYRCRNCWMPARKASEPTRSAEEDTNMRATGEKPDPVGHKGMAGTRSNNEETADHLTVNGGPAGPEQQKPALPNAGVTEFDALEAEALADPVVRAAYRENLTARVRREALVEAGNIAQGNGAAHTERDIRNLIWREDRAAQQPKRDEATLSVSQEGKTK